MKYEEIEGDLISLARQGKFDVIAHGCNCFCTMGAGIAPQMQNAFGVNTLTAIYTLEDKKYKGDINKLGQIQYHTIKYIDGKELKSSLSIVNAYTQFMYGTNHTDGVSKPLDYEALTLCLRKINHIFKGKHIGLPLIGCHLAGGIWDYTKLSIDDKEYHYYIAGWKKDVKTIIKEQLKDMNVTIVHYKPK